VAERCGRRSPSCLTASRPQFRPRRQRSPGAPSGVWRRSRSWPPGAASLGPEELAGDDQVPDLSDPARTGHFRTVAGSPNGTLARPRYPTDARASRLTQPLRPGLARGVIAVCSAYATPGQRTMMIAIAAVAGAA
jgi:hypothetical protein